MPSCISKTVIWAASIAMAASSAIPQEVSAANEVFRKRDLATCPSLDNTRTPGGRFLMRCDRDTKGNGGREKQVQASSFEDCMVRCENSVNGNWCNFVAYPAQVNSAGPCYMKAGNGGGYNVVSGTKLGIRA